MLLGDGQQFVQVFLGVLYLGQSLLQKKMGSVIKLVRSFHNSQDMDNGLGELSERLTAVLGKDENFESLSNDVMDFLKVENCDNDTQQRVIQVLGLIEQMWMERGKHLTVLNEIHAKEFNTLYLVCVCHLFQSIVMMVEKSPSSNAGAKFGPILQSSSAPRVFKYVVAPLLVYTGTKVIDNAETWVKENKENIKKTSEEIWTWISQENSKQQQYDVSLFLYLSLSFLPLQTRPKGHKRRKKKGSE